MAQATEAKRPKLNKEKHKAKKQAGRLIVRNISFEATEDDIREHFSKCGRIKNIKLLTKSDGKRVGCCFVHFTHLLHAQKAVKELNATKIKGRIIAVDWAVEKSQYSNREKQARKKKKKPKTES